MFPMTLGMAHEINRVLDEGPIENLDAVCEHCTEKV
jgi:hypothetical protein